MRQTKNLAYLTSKYLIAQVHYVKRSWVKGEGKGISENLLHDDIKICVDPKTPRSLGLEKFEENFVLSWASESPWGIEPQTFGFHAPMLYHWATETLRWTRSITKFIWHASCILLGSAKSWIICKCNISITEFYLDHFYRESHLIFNKKPSVKPNQATSLNVFPRVSTGALL